MKNGDAIIRREEEKNNFKKWWGQRSDNQKKGSYCILGLVLAIVVLLIIYFLYISDHPVTCTTPECYAASMEISSYIDENVAPCDDFYKFACGSFLKNVSNSSKSVKNIMEESIKSDINNMLEEPISPEDLSSFNLAKQFYKACMNENAIEEQGLKKILHIFKQMGGWPLLEGDSWNCDRFDWRKAVRNLRAFGINFDLFFNVRVDIDSENPSRYILGIHDNFYSPSEISSNMKVVFLDYMVEVASQFDVKSANIWKEQNEVLEFLLNLSKVSKDSQKTNKSNLYNPYTLSELQYEYDSIHWYEYLQGILGSSATLHFDDIVVVSEPIYLKKLEMLLRNTHKRVLANFMAWHTLQYLINFLPSKILDRAYDYLQKVNGKISRKPRWHVCVEAARDRLSSAINLAYIERHFDDDTRVLVTDLIRNVKNQFKKNILMLDWIYEETKRKLMKTLLSSREKIFSYNDLTEFFEENSAYEGVEIDEGKLLQAVLDLDLVFWNIRYGILGKQVKDDWIKSQAFITGQSVEYSPTENTLKFPLGLFRDIYYDSNRPEYMNYGILGSVLAHQISHIFIDAESINVEQHTGAQQRLINWWSSKSLDTYAKKLECLSSQYGKLELRDIDNFHTNSIITRDEDIADLAGLKVAYNAYNERAWRNGLEPLLPGLKYSPRQLFWISSALQFCSRYPARYLQNKYSGNSYQHSPNEFRVNGPLQNLDEFSYDFNCERGSHMNPFDKCHIW